MALADARSFDDFYLATSRRLLGQLTAMTADREQAADVLQEAYAKAWMHWGRVSRLDNPEAWVRTVAWRSAVSWWRRLGVARSRQPLVASRDHHEPDLDSALVVREALARLSPVQRQVLVLHEVVGLTVAEIARETGIPSGTVKSRLVRGRAVLAALLEPEPDEAEEGVSHGSGA